MSRAFRQSVRFLKPVIKPIDELQLKTGVYNVWIAFIVVLSREIFQRGRQCQVPERLYKEAGPDDAVFTIKQHDVSKFFKLHLQGLGRGLEDGQFLRLDGSAL